MEQPRGALRIHAGMETPKISYSSTGLGGWAFPLDFGSFWVGWCRQKADFRSTRPCACVLLQRGMKICCSSC